ncbi:hypothetical protein DYB28_008774 [Aphanomyces astaci]|uniref:RWP-RK domain-containing protein n=1 Tax=Aphanomyces astaci TaxID=112090 RepID=A0A3L6V1I4_APHAT|nr:hypothetical protein AaE_001897 [Aphanomyces astaci]RLO02503.1 hypothetical protein DYB28_008774 [Aphanomyces astaci]
MNLSPQHHKHRLPTAATIVTAITTHKKLLPGNSMTSSTSMPSKKKLNATATHSFSKHITIDILRPHFDKPLAEVAKLFGICTTLMKKVCRRVGIPRWPHRHIRSLRKSILSMETASSMFDGVDRTAYDIQIRKQQKRLAMLLYNPNAIDMDDDDDMENEDDNAQSSVIDSMSSDSRHTSPALHSLPHNSHSLFPSPDLPPLDLSDATFGRSYSHMMMAPSLPRLPSISTWYG